jgi:type II secretory ATPase GspE/PulE/Tfp pilus assembly ATPase PilB-like protein
LGWSDKKELKLYKGEGCRECRHTGYKGRIGLFELITINEEIRNLIIAKASADSIKRAAAKAGSKSLREDGLDKVLAGSTTLDEVMRETRQEGIWIE